MKSIQSFTSQILLVPDTFGYLDITSDIENRLNLSKPIFLYINDEKSIKIEQLRQLQSELASPPIDPAQTRVVIIHPLEKLLHVSQQALLKLLEEPPERTVIFLVGNSLSNLAQTILSRCEVIRVVSHPENAVLSSEEEGSAQTFWDEISKRAPISAEDLVILLSSAPDKKDEALAWIRTVVSSQSETNQTTLVTRDALNDGFAALVSNVTPKLVWGRVVSRVFADNSDQNHP